MKHSRLATFLFVTLFCLPAAHSVVPVAAVSTNSDRRVGTSIHERDLNKAAHVRLVPADNKAVEPPSSHDSLEEEPDEESNQLVESLESTPTPSHPVTQQDNEPSSLLDTAPSPIAASKPVPAKDIHNEDEDDDLPELPSDHYHILGTRAGSSDSTLEKRRVCPVQPLPSNRGCTCPNQTLCRRGRNAPTCVKLRHDHENCGACNKRCGNTQYCQGGKCHCERPK
ncbi:hypothetical protein M408DRAFT_252422 [Serendipita vermifera MAFF 305830]|uniref:Uncharacterized protein n=1 Tax=Serendipita vermifera MAFF 305830 TaxID=933852 RepID=A0A0C3AWN0_SERVB|nr:hypothetical protein M408DRAFT_252422 [Serendipita vermifera MAFF 305830]